MNNTIMEISIPLDEDGFIEMECDFCKNRFMLHWEVYESEDNLNFFCPICGLPNRTNTFLCPEVLENIRQKALNYMLNEINKTLGNKFRNINRNGFITVTTKKPRQEPERELYPPFADYEIFHEICCEIDLKVKSIDKEIGIYCPICGVSNL